MLDWIDSVILGIIEGLTEFLPVSSTGHMILTNKLLGYEQAPETLKSFEVVIQFAAILAIALVYRDRIARMLGIGRVEKVSGLNVDHFPSKRLNLIHILLGIVPPLAVAYLCRDFIKTLGFTPEPVLWALVAGGIYLWVSEALYDSGRIPLTADSMDQITYKQAFLIGLLQCISALWPGFSRSGATMAGGLLTGLSYRASADFSFFLAIPIMTVATGYELLGQAGSFRPEDAAFFLTGFLVSFVVALLVVHVFLKLLQRLKLRYFAWYRFAIAGLFWFLVMR